MVVKIGIVHLSQKQPPFIPGSGWPQVSQPAYMKAFICYFLPPESGKPLASILALVTDNGFEGLCQFWQDLFSLLSIQRTRMLSELGGVLWCR